MEIPSELRNVISIIDNGMIWVYIGIFIILMYLIISLLTWNFIKPLKYLGVATIIVGILLLIIRFSPSVIVGLIGDDLRLLKVLLPSVLKPILLKGILCILVGIGMIVAYKLINIKKKEIIA